MGAWDDNWDLKRDDGPVRRGIYQVTYVIGISARYTVEFLQSPLRMIKNKVSGDSTSSPGSRRVKLTSRLKSMQRRLVSIEKSLVNPRNYGPSKARIFGSASASKDPYGENHPGPASLLEALSDPNPGVRKFALNSVDEGASEDVILLLVDSLNDPDPQVRIAAIGAAGKSNISSAVFSLILLLDDSVPEVREEAARAIQKITGRKVKIDAKSSDSVRRKTIEKLKKWWKIERFADLSKDVKLEMN